MCGQFVPEWFGPVDGAVEPPDDGAVADGAGDDDGSAAETTATPPTTSSPVERRAVAIARRAPPKWRVVGADSTVWMVSVIVTSGAGGVR